MYTIKIYSDGLLQNKVGEEVIAEAEYKIISFEDSLFDGADWWQDDLSGIEEKFNGEWEAVAFVSEDEYRWQIVSRAFFLGQKEPKRNWAISPISVLLSEDKFPNFEKIFSGNICIIENEIDLASLFKFQIPYSKNHMIQLVYKFLNNLEEKESFSNFYKNQFCSIVYSPSPASLTAAKLTDHFETIVNFQHPSDVEYLENEITKLQPLKNIDTILKKELLRLDRLGIAGTAAFRLSENVDSEINSIFLNVKKKMFT